MLRKAQKVSEYRNFFLSLLCQMQNGMDYITLEESKDELLGKVGTAQRDKYEEELRLYAIGAAIRETRKQQNLTQEELGRMARI